MFRMEFQSVDNVDEASAGDDINGSVYEGCRVRRPAMFEGRVGQFGKVHRVSSSTACNATHTGWKEADLMHFDAPSLQGVTHDENTHHAIFLDAQVLGELVERFAELPSAAAHVAAGMDATSVYSGSESMRSTSSFGSDCSSSASEGSVAEMTALQRVNKSPEEPSHKEAEMNLKTHKETKRSAEAERIVSARQKRELRDLANCVHDVSPTRRSVKRNKLQRVLNKTGVTAAFRFLKNPLRVLKSHGNEHEGHPAAQGVNAVITPGMAKSVFYPSETAASDGVLSQMRSAPRQARSQIQFETIQSTQRDVEAWTTEEYMAKNARLHEWNHRKDDEFGGILGNNLLNQCFDDDVPATSDSDSD